MWMTLYLLPYLWILFARLDFWLDLSESLLPFLYFLFPNIFLFSRYDYRCPARRIMKEG
jgi:hypothetical protein